jgi:hypothetical protein
VQFEFSLYMLLAKLTYNVQSADKQRKPPIINPTRMAGGMYDSRNFEQIQLEMAWSENIFLT